MISAPVDLKNFDSAFVENRGPSIQTYVQSLWIDKLLVKFYWC